MLIAFLTALVTNILSFVSMFGSQWRRTKMIVIPLLLINIGVAIWAYIDTTAEKKKEQANQNQVKTNIEKQLSQLGLIVNWINGQIHQKPGSENLIKDKVIVDSLKKNIAPAQNENQPIITDKEYPTRDITAGECVTYGINYNNCYGKYDLINRFDEPILLYAIISGAANETKETLLAPNYQISTPLIRAGMHGGDGNCENGAEEYVFYFRTISKPIKYGSISLTVKACKILTKEISPQNLYLAIDGKKYN